MLDVFSGNELVAWVSVGYTANRHGRNVLPIFRQRLGSRLVGRESNINMDRIGFGEQIGGTEKAERISGSRLGDARKYARQFQFSDCR